MWQAEADEALAKQAHLSVKAAELSNRVEEVSRALSLHIAYPVSALEHAMSDMFACRWSMP